MSLKDLGHPRTWPLHIKVRGICIIAVLGTLWVLHSLDNAPTVQQRVQPVSEPNTFWLIPIGIVIIILFRRK